MTDNPIRARLHDLSYTCTIGDSEAPDVLVYDALLAVLDLCDQVENRMMATAKPAEIRAAVAEALGVEPAAAGRADGSEPR